MARDTHHARLYMSAVAPSDVDAWSALDVETQSVLRRRIRIAAKRITADRRDDVESLAAQIGARFYRGNVDATANLAVRSAEVTVNQAYAGYDALAEWDTYGDATEVYVPGDSRSRVERQWSADPAARTATRAGDVLDAWIGTGILADAIAAYVAHETGDCPAGCDETTRGRRPSLLGILQHVRGLSSKDSEYHALRRQVSRALEGLDVDALDLLITEWLDVRPTVRRRWEIADRRGAWVSRASWRNPHRSAIHSRPVAPMQRGYAAPSGAWRQTVGTRRDWSLQPVAAGAPDVDTVTIRTADGSTRVDSHARLQGHAAEHEAGLPEDVREARAADRKAGERAARFVPRGVAKPSGRRGKSGSGATGPTVPARLS